jgi:hypothetical protein
VAITLMVMGVVLIPWLVGLTVSWLRQSGRAPDAMVLSGSVLGLLLIGVPLIAIAASVMVRQVGALGGFFGTVAMFGLLCAPRFGLLRLHFESLGFKNVPVAAPLSLASAP